jgi:hypothetical protein
MGPGKVQAIEELVERDDLDLAGSYAYSDSATDLPMMEMVGHPVAVNPDKELRRTAEERDWPILEFQRQVSLRTRIPTPSPLVSGATIGAALTAAAVILLLKRRGNAK